MTSAIAGFLAFLTHTLQGIVECLVAYDIKRRKSSALITTLWPLIALLIRLKDDSTSVWIQTDYSRTGRTQNRPLISKSLDEARRLGRV